MSPQPMTGLIIHPVRSFVTPHHPEWTSLPFTTRTTGPNVLQWHGSTACLGPSPTSALAVSRPSNTRWHLSVFTLDARGVNWSVGSWKEDWQPGWPAVRRRTLGPNSPLRVRCGGSILEDLCAVTWANLMSDRPPSCRGGAVPPESRARQELGSLPTPGTPGGTTWPP